MAFDAGTVIAHLDLDEEAFNRKLRKAQAAADKFERDPINLKVGEIATQQQVAQARKAFSTLDNQISRDAAQRSRSSPTGSVLGGLAAMARGGSGGSGGGGGRAGGGGSNQGWGSGLFKGIGPGILGLGTRGSLIAGGIGLAGAALPALAAGGGALGVAGIGAGFVAAGARQLIGTKNVAGKPVTQGPLFDQAQAVMKSLKDTMKQAAEPLIAPLKQAFHQIPILMKAIGPALKQAFAGAGTLILPILHGLSYLAISVLPLLGKAFRAAAPLIEPLLVGLGHLLTGLLPGLITLLHAAAPAVKAIASVLGILGTGLGKMLSAMAPAIKASSVVFRAIGSVVAALFPIIGKLAAILARTLAPIMVDLAKVLKALMPTLLVLARLFASLAGAILKDLVAAFGAVAKLIVSVSPAFTQFAKALSGIFTVLENSGVFAILGNALEKLAKPLGRVISALLRGLTPLLPPLIKFVGQLAGMLAAGLAQAITTLLPPLTKLAIGVLGALVSVLPTVLPLLLQLAKIFTAAVVRAVTDLATALAALVNAIPPKMLKAIVLGLIGLWAAFKGVEIAKSLIGTFKSLRQAMVMFTYSSEAGAARSAAAWVKSTAKTVAQWAIQAAKATWSAAVQAAKWVAASAVIVASFAAQAIAATAAYIAENLATLGIIAGITLLVAAIVFAATHWHRVWGDIKNWAMDAWKFLTHGWGQFLIPGLTLIRLAVELVSKHWKQAWGDIETVGKNLWRWLWTDFGAKINNFFTKTAPGWIGKFKDAVVGVFTRDIPSAFRTAVRIIGTVWGNIQNAVRKPAAWVVDHVINGLISAFDWISGKVGGPNIKQVHPFGLQKGGKLPGYGGGDRHLALLESGEAVVPKEHAGSAGFSAWAKMMGIPGYALGGKVGQAPPGVTARVGPGASAGGPSLGGTIGKIADLGKIMAAIATGNTRALTNAIGGLIPHGVGGAVADMAQVLTNIPAVLIKDAVKTLIGLGSGLGGKGGDIARFAMKFAGQIPYVWGGTAVPGGADCSGFVQSIYRHFGISAPRTSEGQGAWVKKGPPTTGGLALYNSPAGGPPPGHVAIVGFGGNVISQGGGMGPQIVPLRSMALMYTGVPPGGGGLGNVGPGDLRGLERAWTGAGGPGGGTAHIAGAIGMAESGGRSVKQQGQPPGKTGWGVWQITPTSGISQNGRFGNLLNVANNARAAVSLYRQAHGFSPWVTFNDGAYRSFMDSGGWLRQGTSLLENKTGQPEAVLNPGQSQAFLALAHAVHQNSRDWPGTSGLESRLERLIAAVERNAGQTGAAVGDALNGATRSASYRARYSTRGV